MNFPNYLPIIALVTAALSPLVATAASITDPNLAEWYQHSQSTTGNVKADTNGGAGWQFNGTSGYAYDFGNLWSAPTGNWTGFPGNTYEFIINVASGGASQAFSCATGWDSSETGGYGIMNWGGDFVSEFKNSSWRDIDPIGNHYNFGETALMTYVLGTDHTVTLYINGVLIGSSWGTGDSWNQGGQGYLGSLKNGTSNPLSNGSVIYGVATYDRALTASEIAANYAAVTTAIPEPSTYAFAGIAGLVLAGVAFRRRRQA